MATGMNAYDTEVSASVQSEINSVCNELMSVLTGHSSDVSAFQGEFEATEVADMYADVESRLGKSGTAVVDIINRVRNTLNLNDETATQTIGNARNCVASIR